MRDTLLMTAFMGALLLGGVYYFKTQGSLGPDFSQIQSHQSGSTQTKKKFVWKNNSVKGTQNNEAKNNEYAKSNGLKQVRSSDEKSPIGASIKMAQIKGIPDIYQAQRSKRITKRRREKTLAKRIKPNIKSKNEKFVHGVPIQAWVLSSQNQLPVHMPGVTPNGFRVFVQCTELKGEQSKQLNKTECKKILAKGRALERHETF